ncbi:MAG TPA: type II toxin-antitoxin system RelB/DinJ family antitoxin [Anaerolineae bacterium]|nr:type II toxin-antitoxin system RelB/DinJ family antitoxin [Anaerolineae bacterium]
MKTAVVTTRIEPELKQEVENVLRELGLTTSQAVLLYFKQIALQKGLPFPVKVPDKHNTFIDQLLADPLKIEEFQPLTREEVHER